MASVILPSGPVICQAVGGLINKVVKATSKKEDKIVLQKDFFVGTYDDGQGGVEAAIVMDLPLCVSLGCALALIPAAVAKDTIKEGKIEGDIKDNAYEVANILANSFSGRRVRLVGFQASGEIADTTKSLLDKPGKISAFDVAVQGFPGGVLRFCGRSA